MPCRAVLLRLGPRQVLRGLPRRPPRSEDAKAMLRARRSARSVSAVARRSRSCPRRPLRSRADLTGAACKCQAPQCKQPTFGDSAPICHEVGIVPVLLPGACSSRGMPTETATDNPAARRVMRDARMPSKPLLKCCRSLGRHRACRSSRGQHGQQHRRAGWSTNCVHYSMRNLLRRRSGRSNACNRRQTARSRGTT